MKEKHRSLDQLEDIVRRLKVQGKTVVLANGCFDLIHVGHIRYLEEAARQGDILVVALNSDTSVRRLKGHGRPLYTEEERIEVIAALSCVDFVTVFSGDTVDEVLLTLQPHIHAKGSDYTAETVPEKDTVRAYGGRIAITGGPKVKNTSDLLRDIAARFQND